MAKLPPELFDDPTLLAVEKEIEKEGNERPGGLNLSMGQLGKSCARELWLKHRWANPETFNAKTLTIFEDGHRCEDLQAERLNKVQSINLRTMDPFRRYKQYKVEDLGGHLQGRLDGFILGIIQAPKTEHIWEHKAVNDKKFKKLQSLKVKLGEKSALRAWDFVYYVQAILYMHYTGLKRHYMTVTTPGGRAVTSCRTEADTEEALRQIVKAERIVFSDEPPEPVSDDPKWFECMFCSVADVCRDREFAQRNCRTCLRVTAERDGSWSCARWSKALTPEEQRAGCPAHLFNPAMVPGKHEDSGENYVAYEMADGTTFIDEEKGEVK